MNGNNLVINAQYKEILYHYELEKHSSIKFDNVKKDLMDKNYEIISLTNDMIKISTGLLYLDLVNIQKL